MLIYVYTILNDQINQENHKGINRNRIKPLSVPKSTVEALPGDSGDLQPPTIPPLNSLYSHDFKYTLGRSRRDLSWPEQTLSVMNPNPIIA